jgi:hypothetical protein
VERLAKYNTGREESRCQKIAVPNVRTIRIRGSWTLCLSSLGGTVEISRSESAGW